MKKFKVLKSGISSGRNILNAGDIVSEDVIRNYWDEYINLAYWNGDIEGFNSRLVPQIEETADLTQEQSILNHWAELNGLEDGDKFEMTERANNPYTYKEYAIYRNNGIKIHNSAFVQMVFDSTVEIKKLPKTKTITIDGKDVEISVESFNAFKEQFLKED